MSTSVKYQVMPPLSPEEYQELRDDIEQIAKRPGFKRIPDSEIEWILKDLTDPRIARSAIANAMWREAHPGWRATPTTGFVYFIASDSAGLVKIGFSQSPERRVAAIQGMSPVPVRLVGKTPGTAEDEAALHRRFAGLRAHGEWFRMEENLLQHIKEACHA